MAAESGAEGAVADSLGGVRAKRWNITLKEGFQSWQMRVNAYIASKPQYQSVVGVSQMVTVAEYIGYDPSFAAVSPATQAQVLREANANIVTNLNAIYVYVLNSIDMSDDPAFERIVATTYSPNIKTGEPARVWFLLDALNAKGARTTRAAQDELEEEVNEYKPPFDASPAAMARSLKHIVQSFDDLEINAHAPQKRVMEWLIKLLRAGPGNWATYFSSIEISFVTKPSDFADTDAVINTWQKTVFRQISKESGGSVFAVQPGGAHARPTSRRTEALVALLKNDCDTCLPLGCRSTPFPPPTWVLNRVPALYTKVYSCTCTCRRAPRR